MENTVSGAKCRVQKEKRREDTETSFRSRSYGWQAWGRGEKAEAQFSGFKSQTINFKHQTEVAALNSQTFKLSNFKR